MIEHDRNCGECQNKVPIGDTVKINCGNFAGDTYYEFFQCSDCGILWKKVTDKGGPTGTDEFWHIVKDAVK